LSDIDVQATLKKKLDEDMPAYRILGACNPALGDLYKAQITPTLLFLGFDGPGYLFIRT